MVGSRLSAAEATEQYTLCIIALRIVLRARKFATDASRPGIA
jgi:hypothetical protein